MKVFKIILLFLSSFFIYTDVYAESNLVIESVRTTEKSSTMVVSDLSYVDMTITSKMEFHTLNDFVTYEIEIKNNSEKTYTLSKIIDHLNTNYLSVESDDIGLSISKDEKKIIHVKVKYVEELINVESVVPNDSSFTLNFVDTTVIENPFTLDTFYIVFIACILLIVIVGGIIYYKKLQKMVVVLLLFIPIYVFAQEMINVNFNFSRVSVHGRFLSYHIQLDDGSGNVDDYTKTYGDTVGDLPVPEKNGYTFEGWIDQNDRVVNSDTVVEEDLELTATYGLIHYTITYILDGGELVLPNPTSYTVEDEFTLYNPTKTGYTFGGWVVEGSSTLQTQLTIYPGTTGNKTYTALYFPDPSTVYTVIHKQMNLEGVYEETERETLHGATESRVSPQPREYTGFKIPETQTITIAGDGSSSVTYLYERNKYTFQINRREDIESATEDGEYYYGTRVNVIAKIKLGYTLLWNDGSELYERSFLLEGNTILTPDYTPSDNTPYTVIHKQMNLDGETYTIYDEETFYGTTDTTVTPLPNIYEGFTAPEAEELTITGDGEASITYQYTRNKYLLTIENSDLVETTTPSGEYYYGTSITLTAKELESEFVRWSNGDTTKTTTFVLIRNTTIYPVYNSLIPLNVYDFDYSGDEQTFIVPETGYYQLEVWGAQGGGYNSTYHGGYGGYSSGFVYLEKDVVLYLNVGGKGLYIGPINTGIGGYNGGGSIQYTWTDSNEKRSTGGGATHIALSSGLLSSLENNRDTILIVSGGGGACQVNDVILNVSWCVAGNGGGFSGNNGSGKNYSYDVTTTGGTQETGGNFSYNYVIDSLMSGSFGQGSTSQNNGNASGGGGGYYGGASSLRGASGGSGYIGNPLLRNKHMICYDCEESNDASTKTISNQCYSETPQGDCSKENDGYARISYYGFYVGSNIIKSWTNDSNTDFHSSSVRNTITEIEFVDLNHVTVPSVNNTTSWDVSESQDEGVIAWLDGTKLYIGARGKVIANKDSSYIFSDFPNLTSIQFHNLYDTSEVQNMSSMFRKSVKLETLDLSSFDTHNVTNMLYMFSTWSGTEFLSSSLESITFGSHWDTSHVTTMVDMFSGLDHITYLELSNFDTSSVTNMYHMFYQCIKLRTVYVSDLFVTANVSNSEGMLYMCNDIIGALGTKYSSSYIDKSYARIDKSGQKGYFTDYRQGLVDNNTRLQYIESNGSQYIDIYYYVNPNTVIEVDFAITDNRNSSSWAQITGAKNSYRSSSAVQIAYLTSIHYMAIDYGTNHVIFDNHYYSDNIRYYIKLQNQNHYLNDSLGTQYGTLTSTSPYSLWIFDCNQQGHSEYGSKIQLYSYILSENNKVVMNLIPVHNTFLNRNGLYDTIGKRFYYSTSSDFVSGPNAS